MSRVGFEVFRLHIISHIFVHWMWAKFTSNGIQPDFEDESVNLFNLAQLALKDMICEDLLKRYSKDKNTSIYSRQARCKLNIYSLNHCCRS